MAPCNLCLRLSTYSLSLLAVLLLLAFSYPVARAARDPFLLFLPTREVELDFPFVFILKYTHFNCVSCINIFMKSVFYIKCIVLGRNIMERGGRRNGKEEIGETA